MTETQLAIAESDIKVLENLMATMPDHIKTLPDAVATMIVARELGLAPLSSFPDLMVINGAVGMTSKLMLALVLKAGHKTKVIEMSNTRAAIQASRKYDGEWEDAGTFEFTQEQAEIANLWVKDTYELYPADMLMNKAIARMVRFAFPDVLRGYVPDEITDITGVEFENAIHMGPTEVALEAVEVADIMDGEVVDE
jgi:hypothetical protein